MRGKLFVSHENLGDETYEVAMDYMLSMPEGSTFRLDKIKLV